MRATLLAATAALVVAVASTAATAGPTPWTAYVAPAGTCHRVAGEAHTQAREMACLVNWTRRRAGLPALRWSSLLGRAAGSKAAVIAGCGDFSHYACGTRWPATLTRQRQYDRWGENLFYGVRNVSSPRTALLAWLNSPEHRAILFGRVWRDIGVNVRAVSSLDGHPNVRIWVLEVAGRTSLAARG
jgi:uncharacterized protein YkwD